MLSPKKRLLFLSLVEVGYNQCEKSNGMHMAAHVSAHFSYTELYTIRVPCI